jgi:hypothetical protein
VESFRGNNSMFRDLKRPSVRDSRLFCQIFFGWQLRLS